MSLITNYDAAAVDGSAALFKQVYMALVSTAVAIQAESVVTANHAARSAYALRVLADPYGFTKLMLPSFTVDDTALPDDTAIKNRASAVWNAYSVQG